MKALERVRLLDLQQSYLPVLHDLVVIGDVVYSGMQCPKTERKFHFWFYIDSAVRWVEIARLLVAGTLTAWSRVMVMYSRQAERHYGINISNGISIILIVHDEAGVNKCSYFSLSSLSISVAMNPSSWIRLASTQKTDPRASIYLVFYISTPYQCSISNPFQILSRHPFLNPNLWPWVQSFSP